MIQVRFLQEAYPLPGTFNLSQRYSTPEGEAGYDLRHASSPQL